MVENDDTDLYDLAPVEAATSSAPRRVEAVEPVAAPMGDSTPKPLQYRRVAPGHPLTDEQTLRDLYLPLGLLGLGVAVQLGATLISNWHAPQEALRQLGVNLIGGTVVMLVGVMIGLRLRQIQIGSFWVAVLKVAALAVAPTAGAELLGPILGLIPYLGGLAEFALVLVLYFTLIGALFDLDDSDTWYVMCVLIVVRLAVGFGAMALLGRWE